MARPGSISFDLVLQLILQRTKNIKKERERPLQAIGYQLPIRPFSAFKVATCRRHRRLVHLVRLLLLALLAQIRIQGQPRFVVAACVAIFKKEEETQSETWIAEEGVEAVVTHVVALPHVAGSLLQAWRVTAAFIGTVADR